MLTSEQHDTFEREGFVYLRGAFSSTAAAAMEARLWTALGEGQGIRRNTPETWPAVFVAGLQDLKTDPVFEPIGGPVTIDALDHLLGTGRWKRPHQWGQFLLTFPPRPGEPDPLAKATWHTDFPFATSHDRLAGAMVFSFLSEVSSLSGGHCPSRGIAPRCSALRRRSTP